MQSRTMRTQALGSGDLRCWNMLEVDRSSYKSEEVRPWPMEGLGFRWSRVGILQLPPLFVRFNNLLPCFRLLTISGRPV
jgi:hypothetical protein